MHPILFEIPLPFGDAKWPVPWFGVMLLVAFLSAVWVAERRAKKEGINPDLIWDLGMWTLLPGIIGARLLFFLFEEPPVGGVWDWIVSFFMIWRGGLVFYGSMLGGFLGYLCAYYRFLKPNGVGALTIADLAAPAIAIGIFFGRLGCFMNGCCYGQAADPLLVPAWRTAEFPANSPPHHAAVANGWQSGYGFILAEQPAWPTDPDLRGPLAYLTVQEVEPNSPAAAAGLRRGDRIVQVGDHEAKGYLASKPGFPLLYARLLEWPVNVPLRLTVERPDKVRQEIVFTPPPSVPLHPAQVYSSLDGLFMLLLLLAYYPLRRRTGEVMGILMVGYAINRFLIEALRNDTSSEFLFGLTASQDISLFLLLGAVGYWVWIYRRPAPQPAEPGGAVAVSGKVG